MASGNGTPRYRVRYSPAVLDLFQQWADRAGAAGVAGEYAGFLVQMADRLIHNPAGWADGIRALPGQPGVRGCWRNTRLVLVEYTVSSLDRVVRVTRAVLPPGSPLA